MTVTAPDPGSISLTATGYKVKALQKVDLEWTGGTGKYDIYRNNVPSVTNYEGTFYTDNIGKKGGATYIYKVCNTGTTTTCSNEATVVF